MTRKNILAFILMTLSAWTSGQFGPWWGPALVVILFVGLWRMKVQPGLILGGLSLLVVFTFMAVFRLGQDESGLIQKTGLMLGGLSAIAMVLVTGFLGAVTGLLAGWVGSRLGEVVFVNT